MEVSADDSNFVVCRCRHCEENIEFNAGEFAAESSMITCPHCGLETRLQLPSEGDYPEPGDLATEAQLDQIRRLGLTPPPALPFEAARSMIQEAQSTAKATEKQLELLAALGMDPGAEFSRADADEISLRMLTKQGKLSGDDASAPLGRQLQILRFWDRFDLALYTKQQIAQWLNQFYDEDPRRSDAWERFQAEYAHIWEDDPFWVPTGMFESYLM